jgi:hypothetical protein
MLSNRLFLFYLGILLSNCSFSQNQKAFLNLDSLNMRLSSNQDEVDVLIAKRLHNDTLSFLSFTDNKFLDSIVPNRQIIYWEINSNSWNLYNSKNGKNLLKYDSIVLSKSDNGIGSFCPPGWCSWYISARMKDGNIATVSDWKGLKFFIGSIDNQFDAYFWLASSIGLYAQVPFNTTDVSKYKIYQKGYLIRTAVRISECPVTYADVLYFVGKDKKVTFIQALSINGIGGCI